MIKDNKWLIKSIYKFNKIYTRNKGIHITGKGCAIQMESETHEYPYVTYD